MKAMHCGCTRSLNRVWIAHSSATGPGREHLILLDQRLAAGFVAAVVVGCGQHGANETAGVICVGSKTVVVVVGRFQR